MKRASVASAIVVLVIGLGTFAATAASADPGQATAPAASVGPFVSPFVLSDCPSTYLCVWWDSGFVNSRYQFAGNNTSWSQWAIEDDDSSWYNHGTSGLNVQVYKDSGYRNTTICVHYQQSVAADSFANDKGSSNLWGGC
jgi:hypothetical protein